MVAEIDPRKVKVHWTHKLRIKKLYLDGFTHEELAKMYKLPLWYVKGLTWLLRKPDRI